MLREIIGDLRIVPDNHELPAKFHSGTLRLRLMSLFSIIAGTSIRIRLKNRILILGLINAY